MSFVVNSIVGGLTYGLIMEVQSYNSFSELGQSTLYTHSSRLEDDDLR